MSYPKSPPFQSTRIDNLRRNQPMLAANRGTYGKDHLRLLITNRYKDIFIRGRVQQRKNKNKNNLARLMKSPKDRVDTKETTSSPTAKIRQDLSFFIQNQVNDFLSRNPLTAVKLKQLEGDLKSKLKEHKEKLKLGMKDLRDTSQDELLIEDNGYTSKREASQLKQKQQFETVDGANASAMKNGNSLLEKESELFNVRRSVNNIENLKMRRQSTQNEYTQKNVGMFSNSKKKRRSTSSTVHGDQKLESITRYPPVIKKQLVMSRSPNNHKLEVALIPQSKQSKYRANLGDLYQDTTSKFEYAPSAGSGSFPSIHANPYAASQKYPGLLGLGLGGGATTTTNFNFKEKEEDEWHKLVQMEVAMAHEEELQKRNKRLQLNKKFRLHLDQQILERKQKIADQKENQRKYMLEQKSKVAQLEQQDQIKKKQQRQRYKKQKEEARDILMNLRKRKEEEFVQEREEEKNAAQKAKRLYEQDQLKKFQKSQNLKERMHRIMNQNKETKKMILNSKQLQKLQDIRAQQEYQKKLEVQNEARKIQLAKKERTVEQRANFMVEKLFVERGEKLKQEEKRMQEYIDQRAKQVELQQSKRDEWKKKQKEITKASLGLQIKEREEAVVVERKAYLEQGQIFKKQDEQFKKVQAEEYKNKRMKNYENKKGLLDQIEDNKRRKKPFGMSGSEVQLNLGNLHKASQVLKKYDADSVFSNEMAHNSMASPDKPPNQRKSAIPL